MVMKISCQLPNDDKTLCEGVNLVTLAVCCVSLLMYFVLSVLYPVLSAMSFEVQWFIWIMRAEGSIVFSADDTSSNSSSDVVLVW